MRTVGLTKFKKAKKAEKKTSEEKDEKKVTVTSLEEEITPSPEEE